MDEEHQYQYDVIVVGGGIAGVAIAERLSREARRQRKRLSILVVEKRPSLGEEASAGLEGWLHTGFLYAKSINITTFNNCVNALKDLINFYKRDTAFPYRERCNLDIRPDFTTPYPDLALVHLPTLLNPANVKQSWFRTTRSNKPAETSYRPDTPADSRDYLHFIYRKESTLQRQGATVQASDRHDWINARREIFARLDAAFWRTNWLDPKGLCRAPTIQAYDDEGDRARTRLESGDGAVLTTGAPAPSSAQRSPDFGALEPEMRDRLCRLLDVYEGSRSSSPAAPDSDGTPGTNTYTLVRSRDVVIATANILGDLARAAQQHGVTFWCNTEVRITRDDEAGGVRCDDLRGRQLRARLFVLAAGTYLRDLAEGNAPILRELIQPSQGGSAEARLTIDVRNSTMAVVAPPLVDASFVRVDHFASQELNHLLHTCPNDHRYAIVADANSRSGKIELHTNFDGTAADQLRSKIKTYAGKSLDIQPYACNKVEVKPGNEQWRGYDYFVEPGVRHAWDRTKREDMDEWIHGCIAGAPPDRPDIPASGPSSNYLVVLPGKFTLFPSIAHQTYLEAEARGLFTRAHDAGPIEGIAAMSTPHLTIAPSYGDLLCPECSRLRVAGPPEGD